MTKRSWLLNFLKVLEVAIPPPPKCHHALTYSQYGSDDTDWRDELALQLSLGEGKFECLFITEGDMDSTPEWLVDEIIKVRSRKPEER